MLRTKMTTCLFDIPFQFQNMMKNGGYPDAKFQNYLQKSDVYCVISYIINR